MTTIPSGQEWPNAARVAIAANVPDPSGEPDGEVLTTASGAAVWAPGGGSIPVNVATIDLATAGTSPVFGMGTNTSGEVSAVQLLVPAGTYSGLLIPAVNANPGNPVTGAIFIGVYSEDGTTLLAQTADFGAAVEPLDLPFLLPVVFVAPLVLSEPTTVWIGVMGENNDSDVGYMTTQNTWYDHTTVDDGVQTGLTALPDHLNVSPAITVVDITGASSGQYELTPNSTGSPTDPIAWNASAGDVQAALEAQVGAGNVTVEKTGQVYKLTFDPTDFVASATQDTLDVAPAVGVSQPSTYLWVIRLIAA